MLRVPPLVVTATRSVPGDAARRAESMMAPVTVSELFGLITMSFTASIVAQCPGTTPRERSRHPVPGSGPVDRAAPGGGAAMLRVYCRATRSRGATQDRCRYRWDLHGPRRPR